MKTLIIISALAVSAVARADEPEIALATERVHHVPPAGAQAASPLQLVADAPSTVSTLTVHYRTRGEAKFEVAELVRQGDTRWVAVVPAAAVASPGLEYFLAAGATPVFASEA